MKVLALAFAALAAAQNLVVDYTLNPSVPAGEGAVVLSNDRPTEILFSVTNPFAAPALIKEIKTVWRKPGAKKVYLNQTDVVAQGVLPSQETEFTLSKVYSVPTREHDVLFDVTFEVEGKDVIVTSAPTLVKNVDPRIAVYDPRFLASLVLLAGVTAFLTFIGFSVTGTELPKFLQRAPKKKETPRTTPRESTPDEWVPQRHLKKKE